MSERKRPRNRKERKRAQNELLKRQRQIDREKTLRTLSSHSLTLEQLAQLRGSDALSVKQPRRDEAAARSDDKKAEDSLIDNDDSDGDELDGDEQAARQAATFERLLAERIAEQSKQWPKPAVVEAQQQQQQQDDEQAAPLVRVKVRGSTEWFPLHYQEVRRSEAIEAVRSKLPIIMEEQPLVEAVHENPVVIVCGETGSGKTSQMPQFLYEAGYARRGLIGITQPRRVAAMSVAQRVAEEMAGDDEDRSRSPVAYQVRYDDTVSKNTRLKFMTDGVLLKEVQADFLLAKYSVIILDEAHERNLNTDILIGLLSRITLLRNELAQQWEQYQDANKNPSSSSSSSSAVPSTPPKEIAPLKLVIMSATLRVSDFIDNKRLFATPPPVLEIPTRQHPVTVHFAKTTEPDYVAAAFRKVMAIHRRLPPGGILVFLTGQDEIELLCRKLRRDNQAQPVVTDTSAASALHSDDEEQVEIHGNIDDDNDHDDNDNDHDNDNDNDNDNGHDNDNDKDHDNDNDKDHDNDNDNDNDNDDDSDYEKQTSERLTRRVRRERTDDDDKELTLKVLPLYAMLSNERQMEVFKPVAEGERLVVVATNVAETSLTIPGITYVVDCGKQKERVWDMRTGLATYEVQWISRASAEQRSGRAGRTGPGHTYRLYSSAVYQHVFEEHSVPEIQRTPIEGVVLQMKSMGIDGVCAFPFPTAPDFDSLARALDTLQHLGALEEIKAADKRAKAAAPSSADLSSQLLRTMQQEANLRVTDRGRTMASFPIAPRYARMLIEGHQQHCMPYIVAIVAALSVRSPFVDTAPEPMRQSSSDIFSVLRAIGAFEFAGGSESFSRQHQLHHKSMLEIRKLRQQLTEMVNAFQPVNAEPVVVDPQLRPPSIAQEMFLRQMITAGFVDQVARLDRTYVRPAQRDADGRRYPKVRYQTLLTNSPVYLHPHSVLSRSLSMDTAPEFVVYHELVHTVRDYITGLTVTKPKWLCALAPPTLVHYGEPMEEPLPRYNAGTDELLCYVRPSLGPFAWPLPPCEYPMAKAAPAKAAVHFLRLLLTGHVVAQFKQLQPYLNASPDALLKHSSHQMLAKITSLLGPLRQLAVCSRADLLKHRKELQKRGFLTGLLLWYPQERQPLVVRTWNDLASQAP